MKLKAPNREAIEVKLEALYHGQAFVKINGQGDYVMLVADRSEMIGELKRLLRALEINTIEKAEQSQALPIELYRPETAWPWLVDKFPWLFDGINTNTEPYAGYLKKLASDPKRVFRECVVCGQPVTSVTSVTKAKYCSPACKQAAYRERKAA